jgi:predicted  nucleic acid-binding Zn-ribbon protein
MICNVKRRIREKEAAFEVAKSDFYKAQNQLSDKESKIKDLQSALEKKDAAVKDIRAKVADALTGFQSSV